MGKISLSGKVQEQPVQPEPTFQNKQKVLPSLNKKEWATVSSGIFIIFFVGFCFGFIFNTKRIRDISDKIAISDPLVQLEEDLNNKLILSSKQLVKIEDDDLYKLYIDVKGKKIDAIKEQLKDIKTFRSNHINAINLYYNSKKDELKQKEILYHR